MRFIFFFGLLCLLSSRLTAQISLLSSLEDTPQEPAKYKKPSIRLEIGSIFENYNSALKIEDDYGITTSMHINVWQKLYSYAEYRRTESRFDFLQNPVLEGPVDINTYVVGVYGYHRILQEITEELLVSLHMGMGFKRFSSTLFPQENDTAPLYTVGLSLFAIEPYSHMYVRAGLTFDIYKTSFNQRNHDTTSLTDLVTFVCVGFEF